jgi:hypothetical protein
MEQNLALTSSRLGADIARDDVRAQFGGHLPTVSLVVGKSHFESDDTSDFPAVPGFPNGGALSSSQDGDTNKSVSLQVTVPIWASGGTQSLVRQQSYRWQAAKQRLERVSRQTERTARDAYLGVMSEISRVQALKQALESSATALRATEAGYDVGTRTAVDVLAARQQLVQAQTQYSRSRYDYMINVLTLKQAAGILDRKALEDVNSGWRRRRRRPIRRWSRRRLPVDPARHQGNNGSMNCMRRATAPRFSSTAFRPLAPIVARAAGSASRSVTAAARVLASSTRRTAPRSTSIRAMSAELKLCGPATMGRPSAAGSSRLCPPTGTSVPPTNATSPRHRTAAARPACRAGIPACAAVTASPLVRVTR